MPVLVDTTITIQSGELYTSPWVQPADGPTSASITGLTDGWVDAWLEWTENRQNGPFTLGSDVFAYVHGPGEPWKLQGTEVKRARYVRLRMQNYPGEPVCQVRLQVWT